MKALSRRTVAILLSAAMLIALVAPLSLAQAQAQLRGVLLDAEGLPATGYQLGLRNDAGDLFLSAPTGADAQFVLTELPPGNYRLVAFDQKGVEFPVLSREVELGAGQVERVEIRLGSAEGISPGRTATAPAASGGSWWSGLPLWGKIGIVAVGAFGVYAVADDDDDDDEVSPSQP